MYLSLTSLREMKEITCMTILLKFSPHGVGVLNLTMMVICTIPLERTCKLPASCKMQDAIWVACYENCEVFEELKTVNYGYANKLTQYIQGCQ